MNAEDRKKFLFNGNPAGDINQFLEKLQEIVNLKEVKEYEYYKNNYAQQEADKSKKFNENQIKTIQNLAKEDGILSKFVNFLKI